MSNESWPSPNLFTCQPRWSTWGTCVNSPLRLDWLFPWYKRCYQLSQPGWSSPFFTFHTQPTTSLVLSSDPHYPHISYIMFHKVSPKFLSLILPEGDDISQSYKKLAELLIHINLDVYCTGAKYERQSMLSSKPTTCDYIQFHCCQLLYTFRVVTPPIIRSAYNCNYSIWYMSYYVCCTATQIWLVPDAVVTVIRAPDDGWSYHLKHVEQSAAIKLYIITSRLLII
jgi:hypothetical protein